MSKEVPTSFRLPAELLNRADALVERVRAATKGLRVNRSQVLVLALERGIEALDREYPKSKSGTAK